MSIFELGRTARKSITVYSTPDDGRPVKLLEIRQNVWQIVYAD
jgi:hypothetical protein